MDKFNQNGYFYNGPQMSRQKQQKKPGLPLIIILVIFFGVVSGIFGAQLYNRFFNEDGTPISGTGYKIEKATGSAMTVQDINNDVKNSVVEIKTEGSQLGGNGIGEYVTEGAGSGVVIKKDGYIMTNNHVIKDAAKIQVTLGKKNYSARLIGTNAKNDVAVIKINAKNLTPVHVGDSSKTDVGDMAVVIGNPLGELGGSVTAGIVSATNRNVTMNNQKMTLMQTDASVNPGNSGGGMFNDHAQLIGLVVAKSSGDDVEGLGFAIPSNRAAKIAGDIIKGKADKNTSADTGFSGMTYQEVATKEDAQKAGVTKTGVYVSEILTSNAQQAGFQVGDYIYSIDGGKIKNLTQLQRMIQSKHSGDKIKVVVQRAKKSIKITETLISKEDYAKIQENGGSEGWGSSGSSNGFDSGGNSQGDSSLDEFFNSFFR